MLNNSPEDRTIYLLGRLKGDPTDNKAIAILSKTEFQEDQVKDLGKNKALEQEEYFHNDIFRKYWLKIGGSSGQVQCNLIYPATEMLITKYTSQQVYSVRETQDIY